MSKPTYKARFQRPPNTTCPKCGHRWYSEAIYSKQCNKCRKVTKVN